MDRFPTEELLTQSNLFWQFPVKTEEEFYLQSKDDPFYVGIPWATVIDKKINIEMLQSSLKPVFQFLRSRYGDQTPFYTCCQHIHYRNLIPLFKEFGIAEVFSPHKTLGEDYLEGIKITACPLYAVNFEVEARRKLGEHNGPRDLFYSFVGAHRTDYLSDIRQRIFNLPKRNDSYIENTGDWHFEGTVYSAAQSKENYSLIQGIDTNQVSAYNSLLRRSIFSLCPSGTGPNSIRFWEALAFGSIPVILSDDMSLPDHPDWDKAILRIPEGDVDNIALILSSNLERVESMREACLKIYEYFRSNYSNERPTIIHYCVGSYYADASDHVDLGGVARFDACLRQVIPTRIFIRGQHSKQMLLEELSRTKNPIVITDNQLSVDIPVHIKCILFHHGVARTHAERDPYWDPYWRDLCVNGQDKMLNHREPHNTLIVSCSTFCSEEFERHYGIDYMKFTRVRLLHASDLVRYKTIIPARSSANPIILGNWVGYHKGQHIVQNLKVTSSHNFHQLSVPHIKNDYNSHCVLKCRAYLEADAFLQLSLHEGNAYATLDALSLGLPTIATKTGLTYKDLPDTCYVALDFTSLDDIKYVLDRVDYALAHSEVLRKNCEAWLRSRSFESWRSQLGSIINYMNKHCSKDAPLGFLISSPSGGGSQGPVNRPVFAGGSNS